MSQPSLNRPKVSTLPRRQSEATILLDLHKLATEKSRLQQDLARLEARQTALHQRLSQIEVEREALRTAQAHLEGGRPSQPEQYHPRPIAQPRPTPPTFAVTVLNY